MPRASRVLPWRKICSIVEALEVESTPGGLLARALQQIESLVGFDHGYSVVTNSRNPYDMRLVVHRYTSASLWDEYCTHYIALDPSVPLMLSLPSVNVADSSQMRDGEFTLWLAAHDTNHALAFCNFEAHRANGVFLGLFRGKSPFNPRDIALAAALSPHLNSLFHAAAEPVASERRRVMQGVLPRDLTPRERDIAALLPGRPSVSEIAQQLFISRRTAAKHLQRIYAKLRVSGKRSAGDVLLGGEPPRVRPAHDIPREDIAL
jgi:DNA-binding CsgD family transcriptional regulator